MLVAAPAASAAGGKCVAGGIAAPYLAPHGLLPARCSSNKMLQAKSITAADAKGNLQRPSLWLPCEVFLHGCQMVGHQSMHTQAKNE